MTSATQSSRQYRAPESECMFPYCNEPASATSSPVYRNDGELFDDDASNRRGNFSPCAGILIERTALMLDRAVHGRNLVDLSGELRQDFS